MRELQVRSQFHADYAPYLLSILLELHQIGLLKHFGFLEAFRSFVYVPSKEKKVSGHSNLPYLAQISGLSVDNSWR